MESGWRGRFIKAIEADGRTPRAISKAAGLGPNYLTQMLSRGTSPSTPALVSLCGVLGISLTYIFTGAEMSREQEELLQLSSDLTEDQRKLLIDLARQLPSGARR